MMNTHINKQTLTAIVLLALNPLQLFCQTASASSDSSSFGNPLFLTLLFVIILLAIMVLTLSRALKSIIGSELFFEKIKKEKEAAKNQSGKIVGMIFLITAFQFSAAAQTAATSTDTSIGGLDQFTFYLMVVTIFIELLVLFILFNTFKKILSSEKDKKVVAESPKKVAQTIFDKLNYTVPIEEEGSIMLDHDYDGIKELDNNLPPWWKYGFYLTILIAIIYMINYHITKTAPLQAEEYKISMKKAELEIAEYMKTSANNVDENTVTLLTGTADLAAGKEIFMATCSACHGKFGEGTVGPNLTDDYWVHGGSVKDIFKTIKYGWPDKGMKSWKEDYSPIQIAQVTSFIRSLRGTNPERQKDKEGDLYIETTTPSDSTTIISDSANVAEVIPNN